ncbi:MULTISPECIES: hypothetical protein [Arenibacter]|uniref:hypothetical protein n=1 Tax=Arenibacter TaxID=178469 RepID=UPI0013000AD8|nr:MULTISPECIES: hypothetical protein [Arenibacter]
MYQKDRKGLKPWLFKSIAVFIALCYLIVPLQQGLTELMHFLSHSFDHVSQHHSIASHSHGFNDHDWQNKVQTRTSSYTLEAHEHIESNEIGLHDHPHPHNPDNHGHEIIDFMSMAFSASAPTHQDNDKFQVQPELDKHLVVNDYKTSPAIPTFKKSYFSNIKENTSKGIQTLILPPPKPLC